MPRRPFLVLDNRTCVPLEGPYRIEELEGKWWVLGHNEAIACRDERDARQSFDRLHLEHDAHGLAAEALEGLPDDFEVASAHS